jgi:hypothetical protein
VKPTARFALNKVISPSPPRGLTTSGTCGKLRPEKKTAPPQEAALIILKALLSLKNSPEDLHG